MSYGMDLSLYIGPWVMASIHPAAVLGTLCLTEN